MASGLEVARLAATTPPTITIMKSIRKMTRPWNRFMIFLLATGVAQYGRSH
jgi:hypothetical protein